MIRTDRMRHRGGLPFRPRQISTTANRNSLTRASEAFAPVQYKHREDLAIQNKLSAARLVRNREQYDTGNKFRVGQ
jgi:hypothetical protein